MAAARDLGVGGGLDASMDQAAIEEQRKKKLLQQQQNNSGTVAPYTGAFMSLTGNQY
jgi:O-acetyl-ADP-ribose deacetylase (regulator of RNase III)